MKVRFWRKPVKIRKQRVNRTVVRKPSKENQLVRIAKLIDHRTSKPRYGLMVLMPVRPDRNHIYFIYRTLYQGNLEWAQRLSKHYKIPIENLLR